MLRKLPRQAHAFAAGLEMAVGRRDLACRRRFSGRAGRNRMKRFCGTLGAAALVLAGVPVAQVRAAPPTVTPSPGYDARLQEQRATMPLAAPVDPFANSLAR